MVSILLVESTVSMKMSAFSNSRRFVFGWRRQNSTSPCMRHHYPTSTLFISSPSSSATANNIHQNNKYAYPRHIKPIYYRHKTRSLLQMTSSTTSTSKTQEGFNISIEYCSSCRWMLRGNWILSELLTTFANEDKLVSISLIPQGPPLCDGGIFRICASNSDEGGRDDGDDEKIVLWDRKMNGRFPESKEVKQLVRDVCNPDIDLGHSDVAKEDIANSKEEADDCIECKEEQENGQKSTQQSITTIITVEDQTNTQQQRQIPPAFYKQNHISIEYSVGSSIESPDNGLYQATYYVNEILSMIYERNVWWKKKQQEEEETTSNDDDDIPAAVDRVTIIPIRVESGILRVKLNDDKVLYDQLSDDSDDSSIMSGRHLREIVSTAIVDSEDNSNEMVFEMMSDVEAEEARKYFGVF